ncbi:MORN repeat-containing protein [Telluria sp. B2]
MKPVLFSFFIAAAASGAIAAPANAPARANLPGYTGFDDCRIAPLEPAPRDDAVDWSGACEGGFAVGKGELDWKDASGKRYRIRAILTKGEIQDEGELRTDGYTYIGSFLRGRPHGAGYLTFKSGNQYEGGFVEGKQEGKAIFLWTDGTEYTGEWKNGMRHGWGEIKYAEGGSYTGQWQESKRHGRGRIVYVGSGRVFEGEFENDLVAGTTPLVQEISPESLQRKNRSPTLTGYLPLDLTWDKMTEPQKNVVRQHYRALRPGDDPPYPATGTRAMFEAIVKANGSVGAEGLLRIDVLVGANGKAKKVKVHEKPQAEDQKHADWLLQQVADALMRTTYKSAVCEGQPCEMLYPFVFNFEVSMSRDVPAMFR